MRYFAATRSLFFIWERRDVDIPIPQAITEKQQQEQENKLITKIFSEILLKVALLIILMSRYVDNYKLVANIERLILFGIYR